MFSFRVVIGYEHRVDVIGSGGTSVGSECELTVVSTYLASSFLNLLYRVVVSKHDGGVA